MSRENEISGIILDAAITVHRKLGPGLLESVYERVLEYELKRRGLIVERQKPIAIEYEDLVIKDSFRADLVVEDKVIVELKSVERIEKVHKKQVLTYIRLADMRLGLLINFGAPLLKDGIFRIVNGLEE
ncbi:MAG: GxxExxY protein [Candidatus Hydrogenedentes bacterium]|nr:GxxExxY protein [Candidatus Hydrogenedentota bacterium]